MITITENSCLLYYLFIFIPLLFLIFDHMMSDKDLISTPSNDILYLILLDFRSSYHAILIPKIIIT